MVSKQEIMEQLARIGVQFRFFGKPEVRELAHIINPGEHITHLVNGFYQGGMALLVTTNQRLLLIDKKPLFLNLEDIRYEMISELDYVSRLLDGTINLCMSNKKLSFRSFSSSRLRDLCRYTQNQITHFRRLSYDVSGQQISYTANFIDVPRRPQAWRPYSNLLPRKRPAKFTIAAANADSVSIFSRGA